jgi:hypothetical protein
VNTVQGPPSGHHPFPPPCSIENPSKINPVDLPADKDRGNFHLGFAEMQTNPLPERCQFFFSDGRQCRLPAKVFRQDELSAVKKDGPGCAFTMPPGKQDLFGVLRPGKVRPAELILVPGSRLTM